MTTTHHTDLYIAGAWRPANGTADLPVTDCFTEKTIAEYRCASHADVDAAVQAAGDAFPGWSATPPTPNHTPSKTRSLHAALPP